MSIRRAASCCQPRHESSAPRGARTGRAPGRAWALMAPSSSTKTVHHELAEPAGTERADRDDPVDVVGQVDVIRDDAAGAIADPGVVAADRRLRLVPGDPAGLRAGAAVERLAPALEVGL